MIRFLANLKLCTNKAPGYHTGFFHRSLWGGRISQLFFTACLWTLALLLPSASGAARASPQGQENAGFYFSEIVPHGNRCSDLQSTRFGALLPPSLADASLPSSCVKTARRRSTLQRNRRCFSGDHPHTKIHLSTHRTQDIFTEKAKDVNIDW